MIGPAAPAPDAGDPREVAADDRVQDLPYVGIPTTSLLRGQPLLNQCWTLKDAMLTKLREVENYLRIINSELIPCLTKQNAMVTHIVLPGAM